MAVGHACITGYSALDPAIGLSSGLSSRPPASTNRRVDQESKATALWFNSASEMKVFFGNVDRSAVTLFSLRTGAISAAAGAGAGVPSPGPEGSSDTGWVTRTELESALAISVVLNVPTLGSADSDCGTALAGIVSANPKTAAISVAAQLVRFSFIHSPHRLGGRSVTKVNVTL
jgi:hypothetical protein